MASNAVRYISLCSLIMGAFGACPRSGKNPHSRDLMEVEGGSPTATPTQIPYLPPPFCNAGPTVLATQQEMWDIYVDVKRTFYDMIEGYNEFQMVELLGMSVRLPFHDAAEIMVTDEYLTYGPDGCLSNDGDNGGLYQINDLPYTLLEPIWQQYCTQIGRGDFWALWGKITMEYAALPEIVNADYYWGRIDNTTCLQSTNRLPDSTFTSIDYTEQLFVTQMGLTLAEGVTLLGAHSVGRVHINNTGFGFNPSNSSLITSNAWDFSPAVLDNFYYQSVINFQWVVAPAQSAPYPYHKQDYESTDGSQNIMLNADLNIGFLYFNSTECPAAPQTYYPPGDFDACPSLYMCGGSSNLCPRVGTVAAQVDNYMVNNTAFVTDYAKAYTRLVNVGYFYPNMQAGQKGPLGTLIGPLSDPGSSNNGLSDAAVYGIISAVIIGVFGIGMLVYFKYWAPPEVASQFNLGKAPGDTTAATSVTQGNPMAPTSVELHSLSKA